MMADPLLTPAIVGAIVSELLKEVIVAAKSAIRCKDECKTLATKLRSIAPLIKEACQHSTNGNATCTAWLEDFKVLLRNAETVTKECLMESRFDKGKRLLAFWRWKKLPSRVKNINIKLDKQIATTSLVTLGIVLHMNAPLVSKVVDFVPQPTPPFIVGVEKPFNELKTCIIANHAKDVCNYLGLQGRGGAGKTLFAQMLHNDGDIKATYGENSILWITVGLDARISDLYGRMAFLLRDALFKEEYANHNLEEQRAYLMNVFAKKKVLLILDDVWQQQHDHKDMIFWLDIAKCFGSTTLITTRSVEILAKFKAEVQVVLSLPEEESWELFRSHAFRSNIPASTMLVEVAKEVCKECKGLPLALKVIGSAMLGKIKESEWRYALDKLRQSKPILGSNIDDELFGRLEWSYNELKDNETKICFLYFAAFREDEEIRISDLLDMWRAEGLFGTKDAKDVESEGKAHLEVLVRRSLIDYGIVADNSVKVHDILRDLAMHIIDKAKPGECAYECFFQAGKMLKSFPTMKSFQEVKRMSFIPIGIPCWPKNLEFPNLQVCIFSEMSNMDTTPQTFECFFSNMQTLQYLDLSYSLFNFGSLHTTLKDLGKCKSLMHLNLRGCQSLHKFPETIGELERLLKLDLSKCILLEELPKSICRLKYLTILDLNCCESLVKLPQSIGELNSLTKLDLRECRSLEELPESIGQLQLLTTLLLNGCGSLKEIPKSIGQLNLLTELNLSHCRSLEELPETIGQLQLLTTLLLYGCDSLKELPKSIGQLNLRTKLKLSDCRSLEELPESIGQLQLLTTLLLNGCGSLKELPKSIGQLNLLTNLDLCDCRSLEELPKSIGQLQLLTTLSLNGCGSLKELPKSIGQLNSLTDLDLRECKSLEELPESIGQLQLLTRLRLYGCGSLKELPKSIGQLNSLTRLDLRECKSLEELPESIGQLQLLTTLFLNGCGSWKELPKSIGQLNLLTEVLVCEPVNL